jgi:hypothetical protein
MLLLLCVPFLLYIHHVLDPWIAISELTMIGREAGMGILRPDSPRAQDPI